MATKLWLRIGGASEPKPGAHQTGDAITHYWQADGSVKEMIESQGSSGDYVSYSDSSSANHYDYIGQWISPPLASQSIPANNWTLQWTDLEANTSANFYLRYYVYVWRANDTKGPDIIAPTSFGTEATTSYVRHTTGVFGSAVSINEGDRIVVELLADVQNKRNTAWILVIRYDGPDGGDADSWLNSAQTLAYAGAAPKKPYRHWVY